MGHTHCPSITPLTAGVMVNTGTCSRGRTMWASVDTERGSIEVHEGERIESYRLSDEHERPSGTDEAS